MCAVNSAPHTSPKDIYVILAAAGLSSRMETATAGKSKNLLPMQTPDGSELPVLGRTIKSFAEGSLVHGMVVSAREADREEIESLLAYCAPNLTTSVVRGGKTRQESVHNALKALPPECEVVLVHDGARPFAAPEQIKELIDEVKLSRAAILAIPATTTLKEVNDGVIVRTVPRENIWHAQSPQGFSAPLLKAAYDRAVSDNFTGTDDSALVERLGIPVKIVRGSRFNMKITTPEDLQIAAAYVQVLK